MVRPCESPKCFIENIGLALACSTSRTKYPAAYRASKSNAQRGEITSAVMSQSHRQSWELHIDVRSPLAWSTSKTCSLAEHIAGRRSAKSDEITCKCEKPDYNHKANAAFHHTLFSSLSPFLATNEQIQGLHRCLTLLCRNNPLASHSCHVLL